MSPIPAAPAVTLTISAAQPLTMYLRTRPKAKMVLTTATPLVLYLSADQ